MPLIVAVKASSQQFVVNAETRAASISLWIQFVAFALDEHEIFLTKGGKTPPQKTKIKQMPKYLTAIQSDHEGGKTPRKTRYIITGLQRFLLVCSHVRGWDKLQRVGGCVGGGVWWGYLAVIQRWRGVANKAACVIYGVELQHRNVLRGCTHLQKPSQEVRLSLLGG